jgi:hypothetical protein
MAKSSHSPPEAARGVSPGGERILRMRSSLRLVARLHVDLQRTASAVCRHG